MEHFCTWPSIESQVDDAIEAWNGCALPFLPPLPRLTPREQRKREKAYDKGLRAVQREARRAPRTPAERLSVQQRIVALFPGFAATALGLDAEATNLLTNNFLPTGTQFARWARSFDPSLSIDDIIQACRNSWTCCGLQPLLGQPMGLTPSIVAYSLLYPYSDNCLDHSGLSTNDKLQFSERFRQRLRGRTPIAHNPREASIWRLVQLIEDQYPREQCPQVFDSLLAIHRAQEESIAQLSRDAGFDNSLDNPLANSELLRITCAKGGTSVLADACLAQPRLTAEDVRFSFEWGVLLQLGDDLQDVAEDRARGSVTLFTRAIAQGISLDSLVLQLLHFSHHVSNRIDLLANGSRSLKDLLRMSWRSLILMAVADAHEFFSPTFLAQLEPCSGFRFEFLRARNNKLTARQALFTTLFDAFLEAGEGAPGSLPSARESHAALSIPPVAELPALSNSFA
jgi:hypothetical protein